MIHPINRPIPMSDPKRRPPILAAWSQPATLVALIGLFALHAAGGMAALDDAVFETLAAADGPPSPLAAPLVVVGAVDDLRLPALALRHGWLDVALVDAAVVPAPARIVELSSSPLLCAWVDCVGSDRLLVEAVDVPMLSLEEVAAAEAGQIDPTRPVFVTGWASAGGVIAQAVASARDGGLYRMAGLAEVGLWILASFIVASTCAATARGPRRVAGAALPFMVTGAGFLTGQLLPLLGPLLAAGAGIAAVALAEAAEASAVQHRLSSLARRAASQGGALRRKVHDVDELYTLLVDIVRTHAPAVSHALILLQDDELVWHAGMGLDRDELSTRQLQDSHPDIAAALAHRLPVSAGLLVPHGHAMIVPLVEDQDVVALWLLRVDRSDALPHYDLLAGMVAEVSSRLALTGSPESADPDTLRDLLGAANDERGRWSLALQGLGAPMLVADVVGRVELINPAMQRALDGAGVPRPRTVAELMEHAGPDGVLRLGLGARGRLVTQSLVQGEQALPVGFSVSLEAERPLLPASTPQPAGQDAQVRPAGSLGRQVVAAG